MYHTNHSNPQYAANGNVYRTNRTDHEKESFRNFWELNMKCFQEMYLDRTSTQTQQLSNKFSSTAIAGANSLTPSTLSPLLPATDDTVMQHSHHGNFGASVSAAAHGRHFQAATEPNMHQLIQQQQLAAAAVAQHQLALAAGRGSNQQQDEISKSLKMFAMLTAYKTGTEPTSNLQAPVDDIMKDFACNGHICDELNRYHQYQAALQFAHSGINNRVALNVNSAGNNIINNTAPSIQHFNVNMNDVRTNIWKMLPSHVQQTQVASTNIDYNSNRKSLQKQRSNGSKIEKYSSPKHCVFCENNNEPEAVVQSHSVRDTLGRVLCPKLRTYVCPICKASGDMAHTIKYCPQKPIVTMEDAIKAESYRLAKGTFYKQQMKI